MYSYLCKIPLPCLQNLRCCIFCPLQMVDFCPCLPKRKQLLLSHQHDDALICLSTKTMTKCKTWLSALETGCLFLPKNNQWKWDAHLLITPLLFLTAPPTISSSGQSRNFVANPWQPPVNSTPMSGFFTKRKTSFIINQSLIAIIITLKDINDTEDG